jgi:NAD-dependent DNA ligase
MPKDSKKSTKRENKQTSKKASLTDIPGVGDKTAESLREAGFKTVASLAKTEPLKLMKKVDGIGEVMASRIIGQAKKLAERGLSKRAAEKKKTAKRSKPATKKKQVKIDSSELDELAKELESEDEQVLLGAIDRLAIINDPRAVDFLVGCLKHSRYMVRIHAAAQLGERKDKRSVDSLIESLNDESIFVRQTAAGALENIGGGKAKKAIETAEKNGLLLDDLPEGKRLEQR